MVFLSMIHQCLFVSKFGFILDNTAFTLIASGTSLSGRVFQIQVHTVFFKSIQVLVSKALYFWNLRDETVTYLIRQHKFTNETWNVMINETMYRFIDAHTDENVMLGCMAFQITHLDSTWLFQFPVHCCCLCCFIVRFICQWNPGWPHGSRRSQWSMSLALQSRQ